MSTPNNEIEQTNKVQRVSERIKALAMGLIGALFLSFGFQYFQEQESYSVPRILIPVFELFGNIGLAIGLLILAIFLMFFAYRKFVKFGGKSGIMLIVLVFCVIFSLAFTILVEKGGKGKTKEERMESLKEKLNSKSNIARPQLDDIKANEYFDKKENILAGMKKAKETNDEEKFKALEQQYWSLNRELGNIIPKISKTPMYRDFALYSAQLDNEIDELRGIAH